MARYNLKLFYKQIDDLADVCKTLANSIDDVKTSAKNMDMIIEECNGKAAEAIKGDGLEISNNVEALADGLKRFAEHLNKYRTDMSSIINCKSEGMMTINTVDVNWNIRQMINDISDFEEFSRNINPAGKISDYYGGLMNGCDSEVATKVNNIEGKLDALKESMIAAAGDILKYEDDFESIRKLIEEFENKDDEYRDILQEVYYEIADIGFWRRTSTKMIIGIGLIVVAAAIIFLAPALVAVGGVVGSCAAAIAGCGWLVTVATEVFAVGIFTGVFAGGIAIFSGDDIEDAVGGGLFDGAVSSVITGGAGVLASSSKYVSYGTKILSNTKLANNKIAQEVVEFAIEEGTEYGGEIISQIGLAVYNGRDVNLARIGMTSAFDRGIGNVFKGIGNVVDDYIDIPDIKIIRDGSISINDISNAVKNGVKKKSLEVVKEATVDVGHDMIDNYIENSEEGLSENKEDVEVEIDPSEVSNDVVKKDLKGRTKDIVSGIVSEDTVEEIVEDIIDE